MFLIKANISLSETMLESDKTFSGLIGSFVSDDAGLAGDSELFVFEVVIFKIINTILNMKADIQGLRTSLILFIALRKYKNYFGWGYDFLVPFTMYIQQ